MSIYKIGKYHYVGCCEEFFSDVKYGFKKIDCLAVSAQLDVTDRLVVLLRGEERVKVIGIKEAITAGDQVEKLVKCLGSL